MRFLSVCSGIEAASCAWQPLGWKAVAFSEIEPFPCAVLANHYPDVPNRGDMTNFKDWPDEPIDLLCGGTPCQSFSVAGLRKGLDDPRGNLMLTYGAIAAKYRPKWLVWENVPGVLSSNGGRDFGSFLGLLGQLGYGFAYRVLDAQYFGVAQRRRRVFVVGCLGDWRSAAAVLFERHSLQGHPAPSRQAGKGTAHNLAPSLTASGRGVERCGETRGQDPVVAVETLCVATGQAGAEIGAEIGADMAPTLNCNHEAPYIAHSLRGEGFDASEDGTGRGTPLVPVGFAQNQRDEVRMMHVAGALAAEPGAKQQTYIAQPIAFPERMSGTQCASTENLAPSMGALNPTAVAVSLRGREGGATAELGDERDAGATAIDQERSGIGAMAVRRLTVEECEFLQGFSRGYTAVPNRGKPAADGPRYKALGNSWAVPCARWIGERIEAVEAIHAARREAA